MGVGTQACDLPVVTDYAAPGPFDDVEMVPGMGPAGGHTLFRPSASLGRDGTKHPIVAWGNGIMTTPDQYQGLLKHVASHGFVIVACNDTTAERPCLDAGLTWLAAQNGTGDMAGMLDVSHELTFGYSWGGGAAIDTANRPNVVGTISMHGKPPRESNAYQAMHAPLLLTTTVGDTFVAAATDVTPTYEASQVQTFYATQDDPAGHLYILDPEASGCIFGELFTGPNQGPCESAGAQQAMAVAWMRLWACDDPTARGYFYGDDCTYCQPPFSAQRKNWN